MFHGIFMKIQHDEVRSFADLNAAHLIKDSQNAGRYLRHRLNSNGTGMPLMFMTFLQIV